jgi:polyisoprenoid-binding protein YceI
MTLQIPVGTYGVDTMHTQLGFSVTHLGITIVRGTFDRFSGYLTVGDSLAETGVTIEAEMASINSGNTMRDEHMHSPDFFDVVNHPQMIFQSKSITESDGQYELLGDLTIKGTTAPVVLWTKFNGSAIFPMDQSTHFGFIASGKISRSAFGVSYGVPMVSDEVELNLNAQFIDPVAT